MGVPRQYRGGRIQRYVEGIADWYCSTCGTSIPYEDVRDHKRAGHEVDAR